MLRNKKTSGFSLVEITIVISIIGIISAIIYASFVVIRNQRNDKKRITDMKLVELALEIYRANNGNYPANPNGAQTTNAQGWDTSGNGQSNTPDFILALVGAGLLPGRISDPTSNNDNGNYLYQRFDAGTNGCLATNGAYYVLAILNLQSLAAGTVSAESPGFACTGHNWQLDFAWVTGAYQFK